MIQSDFTSMIIASDYQDKKHGLQAGTFLLSFIGSCIYFLNVVVLGRDFSDASVFQD